MSNAGQLWATTFQIGRESVAGTPVAATRIAYFNADGTLSRTRDSRPHRFAVGRRDNILAHTLGPVQAGGSVGMPISASEILELLGIGVQGGVSPTTPTGATSGRKWVHKPGDLDSATLEWDDGARVWQAAGVRADQIQMQGAANDTNMLTATLFATALESGSLTGALSSRVPTFMEGYQTLFYLDAFGAVPGSTQIPGVLRNWQVTLNNNLGRIYTADNRNAARRVVSGQLEVTAQFTFDAYPSQAATEFANWDAGTKRTARLAFLGPNASIEAAANEVQTVTVNGSPTGGDYTLVVLGQVTGAIAFDAAASAVQTAINTALAALGSTYTVGVSGSAGGPYTVTFSGTGVAGRNVPLITMGTNSLTGGTTPTVSAVETTPGYSGGEEVLVDIPGAWSAVNLGGNADGIRTYELSLQSVYDPTSLAAMIAITCQNSRATAF